ncbi:MAG: hypothetical protein KJ970_10295 [Candidatus Eisenbacteria bacterium]|uniref:Reverse transcriptase domain-containing protein n=1 Tax=Eiseniibacteriota bacterium TaxID=2212470 RepID=A0A948RXD4_UNCEI|nr:hypothetical protein [Candidatus Eisenbacteria bacterium]
MRQGGAVDRSTQAQNPTGGAGDRRGDTQPSLHENLMERVVDRANVQRAWKRVKANHGAPGVDGMTIDDFPAFVRSYWPAIRQALLEGIYQPSPVRRVSIPKPAGRGVRLLGIPTITDRVIGQAIQQILTPIFDSGFSESSFGFRPGRSAHGAIRQLQQYLRDKQLLALIGRYLRAGVLVGDVIQATEIGTPQGSPLSPLLANVLLDDLDKELEQRGHRFVRYADDRAPRRRRREVGERPTDCSHAA